jgi:hypothetical protein
LTTLSSSSWYEEENRGNGNGMEGKEQTKEEDGLMKDR